MPAVSMSLANLHAALQQMTKALNLVGGGATGQVRRDVQGGCILADRLWNLQDLQKRRFNRDFTLQGHIPAPPEDEDAADEPRTAQASGHLTKPRANVDVGVAPSIDVTEWLRNLQRETNPPGSEQLQILRMILDRCLVEAREIRSGTVNMSDAEPLRHMIQGLSGAGKSALIKWICRAFQEVFGFSTRRPLCLHCLAEYYGFVDRRFYQSFLGRSASYVSAVGAVEKHELEYAASEPSL